MKLCVLCFLLLLACMYPSVAQGSYEDCCLKYVRVLKKSMYQKVSDYRMQETDGGCNIRAAIFNFANGKRRTFCADPNEPWVQKLMDKIKKNKGLN